MLNHNLLRAISGGGGGGGGVFSCTFTESDVDTSNTDVYTFSGKDFGDAATDRYIVVTTGAPASAQTLSSVTIGGVAATIVVQDDDDASAGIAIAAVPTGTTGDIVVTWSGSMFSCGIGVYRLTGLQSATASATASDVTITSDAVEASLEIPAGGCGIGYVYWLSSGTATRTASWTNLTENFDELTEGGTFDEMHSGAMSTTAGTSSRKATASGGILKAVLVLASWR